MAPRYYLAPCLDQLADDVFPGFPRRGSTDGWIGDASHAARKSDHNPDYSAGGVVRAIDGDKDGNPLPMERILQLVIADNRTEYVIWEGHIYSRAFNFRKRRYTGSNGHFSHMHISCRHGKAYENSRSSWLSGVHVVQPAPVPVPSAMRIPGDVLVAQHRRAWQQWPFIDDVERRHGLPRFLMYAVGSRETNLQNIKGDYSQRKGESSKRYHGFGVWQRDIQHGIPAGWMEDVLAQAEWSAQLLAANIKRFGLLGGVNAYNSGQPLTDRTTGKNYGPDVLARMEYLQAVNRGGGQEDEVIRIIQTREHDGQDPKWPPPDTLDGVYVESNFTFVKWIPNELVWGAIERYAQEGRRDQGGPVLVRRDEFDTLQKVGNAPWPEPYRPPVQAGAK